MTRLSEDDIVGQSPEVLFMSDHVEANEGHFYKLKSYHSIPFLPKLLGNISGPQLIFVPYGADVTNKFLSSVQLLGNCLRWKCILMTALVKAILR